MVQDDFKEAVMKMAHPIFHKQTFDHSYYQNQGRFSEDKVPWFKVSKYVKDRVFKGDIFKDENWYYVIEDINNNPTEDDATYDDADYVYVSFIRCMLYSEALCERNKVILGKADIKQCELDSWNWFFEDLEEPYLLPLIQFDEFNLCDKCGVLLWVHGFTDFEPGACEECGRRLCVPCAQWDWETGECGDCIKKENK